MPRCFADEYLKRLFDRLQIGLVLDVGANRLSHGGHRARTVALFSSINIWPLRGKGIGCTAQDGQFVSLR